ncbi:glycosyltransferase [Mycolicibacterium crocinum]|uniref:4,4'-diaponeurosporenoate glycosyltransferase n=1 Tax=Mycolicibacterium crocinum TaxID=388459 RepID=A0ABY3TRF4_9MYCO|nr:glycosyltransferase [Mycolicibacterium crocinum]ULN43903.1 glycosyltransferase [Mycolicibacterium crocinum]
MAASGFTRAVIVVPAHNESPALPACLTAISIAAARAGIPVSVVVVLDSCDDGSSTLADRFGPDVHFVEIDAHNVGTARATGFSFARDHGLTGPDVWYATTDADSKVDSNWLVRQLTAQADLVLGVVRIANWRQIPINAVRRYLRAYHAKIHPGSVAHDHIHGANMGFTADAYWHVGGFDALLSAEDVDLVKRFEVAGYRIRRDTRLSVATSARQIGRAPAGFAAHLRGMLAEPERDTA